MSMHALPRQSRQAVAVGLLVAAVAVVAAVLWWLASAFVFDLDARAASAQTRLNSLNSMAGSITDLRAAWTKLEHDQRLSVDMYPPASDAQSSAAVQASVQRVFARAGVHVRSVQTLDVVQDGAVRRVGVRIAVTGTSNQVNRALEALGSAKPVLMVATGGIQTMGDGRRPMENQGAAALQATFDIFAYARIG